MDKLWEDHRINWRDPKRWSFRGVLAIVQRIDLGNGWTRTRSDEGFEQMFRDGDENDYYLEKYPRGRRKNWVLVRRAFDDSRPYPPVVAGPFPDDVSARAAYDMISKRRR